MKLSRVNGLMRKGRRVFGYPVLASFFILIALFAACSSHPKGPPGKDVMKPEKLIDLLADLHYYEGIFEMSFSFSTYLIDFNLDSLDLYQKLFDKHGVERNKFRNSLYYYSYDPALFESLYDRVVNELNRRIIETELEIQLQAEARLAEPLPVRTVDGGAEVDDPFGDGGDEVDDPSGDGAYNIGEPGDPSEGAAAF